MTTTLSKAATGHLPLRPQQSNGYLRLQSSPLVIIINVGEGASVKHWSFPSSLSAKGGRSRVCSGEGVDIPPVCSDAQSKVVAGDTAKIERARRERERENEAQCGRAVRN
ncbi:hypothetical protein TNCT_121521 [Trichonephila clavata]|uniref:Uncharacterized protein n=1 Tax=Trichonephila clavata TaxID=2740835 RepID=A0A8X6IHT4_TRICU|nr:hypothetical protein TNCT_121521 [Trichonephila clavata]